MPGVCAIWHQDQNNKTQNTNLKVLLVPLLNESVCQCPRCVCVCVCLHKCMCMRVCVWTVNNWSEGLMQTADDLVI